MSQIDFEKLLDVAFFSIAYNIMNESFTHTSWWNRVLRIEIIRHKPCAGGQLEFDKREYKVVGRREK